MTNETEIRREIEKVLRLSQPERVTLPEDEISKLERLIDRIKANPEGFGAFTEYCLLDDHLAREGYADISYIGPCKSIAIEKKLGQHIVTLKDVDAEDLVQRYKTEQEGIVFTGCRHDLRKGVLNPSDFRFLLRSKVLEKAGVNLRYSGYLDHESPDYIYQFYGFWRPIK